PQIDSTPPLKTRQGFDKELWRSFTVLSWVARQRHSHATRHLKTCIPERHECTLDLELRQPSLEHRVRKTSATGKWIAYAHAIELDYGAHQRCGGSQGE